MSKIDIAIISWGTEYHLTALTSDRYQADNTLYLELWTDEEPYATLTTCLGLKKSKENESLAFLDTNNFPQGPAIVKELGIGEPTGLYKSSGYCTYPLYKFDLQKVAELSESFDDED